MKWIGIFRYHSCVGDDPPDYINARNEKDTLFLEYSKHWQQLEKQDGTWVFVEVDL